MSVAVGGKHLHRAVALFVIGVSRHDRARSVIDTDNIALRIVGKVIGCRRGLRFGRIMVIVSPADGSTVVMCLRCAEDLATALMY